MVSGFSYKFSMADHGVVFRVLTLLSNTFGTLHNFNSTRIHRSGRDFFSNDVSFWNGNSFVRVPENINQENQASSDVNAFALYRGELVLARSLKVFYENNMGIEKFPIRTLLNFTYYFKLFNGE